MRKGSEVLLELMRGAAGGNEMDFIEIESPVGCAGHGEVPIVNRIEGAAENGDPAGMMFRGGAVRLRGGQCASREDVEVLEVFSADGPGKSRAESCGERPRWSERVRALLRRWPRRWSEIRGSAARKTRAALRGAWDRWWRRACWPQQSSAWPQAFH